MTTFRAREVPNAVFDADQAEKSFVGEEESATVEAEMTDAAAWGEVG